MTTIKSYTDIEQSKKLAEILPPESADMCWTKYLDNGDITSLHATINYGIVIIDYPCWSLGALLDVLPDYTMQTNTDGTVFVVCDSKKPMISDAYNNPIDACYEIIIHLHELKML